MLEPSQLATAATEAAAILLGNTQQLYNNFRTASDDVQNWSYPLMEVTTGLTEDWCNDSMLAEGGDYDCDNGTFNSTFSEENISFILPWWRQILWNILFVGMVIVATGGNLIVVWIVMTTKRMRTVTNYFIVNLSIADAMVSSLNVTFNYIYMLDNDWPFGEVYCKISQFIATLSISASVFTLMAISMDRYVAIMKPLQPRMSKRCNLAIAGAIWSASIIISCPMLLFFTTGEIQNENGVRTVCYPEWPDGSTNHSHQEYIYNILFMILTYFLPIISMTVTYSRVGFELWGSKAIGEYTPRQVENVKSKRRVVKMMMVVVLIFAVCWLPFHAYFIVTSCYPGLTEMPFIQEVYLMIYWLAMSNSMYNPIIYCWMNSRFRFGFKMFFRWCPFVHIGSESLNFRDNMTSRYSCSGSLDHHRIKRIDTQNTLLYTCTSSQKNRRLSSYGVIRNSTLLPHRDASRHSEVPINFKVNPYHQHCSLTKGGLDQLEGNPSSRNIHDSRDYIKMEPLQKWPPAAAAAAAATAKASATAAVTSAQQLPPVCDDRICSSEHNLISNRTSSRFKS